jgi:leader peptidase (prepilin peptidase)/N-methyltransferase
VTLVITAFVLGLLFGSFLNVCISRLPHHQSIAHPRSRCPRCAKTIAWYDNVPLLSYVLLRARCRHCQARISWRYPAVEFAVATSWVVCVFQFGPTLHAVRIALLCWFLIGLFFTDIETYTLPDALTIPGLILGLTLAFAGAPTGHRLTALAHSALAALLFAAFFLLVRGLYWLARRKEGMGLGDVKLIAMMGAFLLISHTAIALFAAVLAASFLSLVLVILKRASAAQTRIPFGAFLAAGGITSAFAGTQILMWYLSLFF